MKKEIKNIAVKSAKLAGVTCVAAGAIALIASGAAVKAVTAGGKYLKDVARRILEEQPEKVETVEEAAPVEETVEAPEETPVEVPEAVEADCFVAEDEAAEEQ